MEHERKGDSRIGHFGRRCGRVCYAPSSMNDARLQSLLRMIAHDLKGLLGTPGLLIHLVETASSDEERAERLTALKESFHALDRTVTDLGDLGHALGETAPASNLQPTDLRSLV